MASKRTPRLRALTGGRPAPSRTLVLHVRAFEDSTSAMEESIKALRNSRSGSRQVSASAARDLLTDQRLHLLRVIRKEQPDSVAALARLVGRPDESLKADVLLLARTGLVVLESPSPKSQIRAPVSRTNAWRSG